MLNPTRWREELGMYLKNCISSCCRLFFWAIHKINHSLLNFHSSCILHLWFLESHPLCKTGMMLSLPWGVCASCCLLNLWIVHEIVRALCFKNLRFFLHWAIDLLHYHALRSKLKRQCKCRDTRSTKRADCLSFENFGRPRQSKVSFRMTNWKMKSVDFLMSDAF